MEELLHVRPLAATTAPNAIGDVIAFLQRWTHKYVKKKVLCVCVVDDLSVVVHRAAMCGFG
jgi:hypothetical protein